MIRLKAALAALMFLFCLAAQPARAQLVGIATGVATGAVIDQIGSELNAMIGRAERSGDFLLMRAGQEGLYILDAFKATNTDLLNVAFDKIGDERRALVNELNDTMGRIEADTDRSLDKVQAMLDQVDDLALRLTFNSYPVVLRMGGNVIVPGENSDVVVTISGANLNDEAAKFEFQGKPYPVKRESVKRLVVSLPREALPAATDKITTDYATLSINHKVGGFFGLFQSDEAVTYSIPIVRLPSALATVEVSYTRTVQDRKENPVDQEVSYNSSSRSWDCRSFAYSPATAERRFDVTKSSVVPTTGNGRGQLRDVSIRDVGISFAICATRGYFDRNNGDRHAQVHYVEYWTEPRDEDHALDPQAVTWLAPATFTIPLDAKSIKIVIHTFTGAEEVRADSGEAGKYASVQVVSDQGQIIVRPKVPDDVRG